MVFQAGQGPVRALRKSAIRASIFSPEIPDSQRPVLAERVELEKAAADGTAAIRHRKRAILAAREVCAFSLAQFAALPRSWI
jgi:hypothetical protein